MPDDVYELVATEVARDKLAARTISPAEVEQVPRNEHRIVSNPHAGGEPGKRRLLIGETDGRPGADVRDRADIGSDDVAGSDGRERDGARAYPACG